MAENKDFLAQFLDASINTFLQSKAGQNLKQQETEKVIRQNVPLILLVIFLLVFFGGFLGRIFR